MGDASVFGFEILPSRRKCPALKNLAGALHTEWRGCTLSVGGTQNGNPVQSTILDINLRWE
jgi:hypothetical protein